MGDCEKKKVEVEVQSLIQGIPKQPVKNAENLIRESGLTPCKVPNVKKALIAHNVMLKGLQKSKLGRKYTLGSSNQQLRSHRSNKGLALKLQALKAHKWDDLPIRPDDLTDLVGNS